MVQAIPRIEQKERNSSQCQVCQKHACDQHLRKSLCKILWEWDGSVTILSSVLSLKIATPRGGRLVGVHMSYKKS